MKNGLAAGCLAHAGGAGSGVLEQKPSKERKEGKGRNEMKGENCVIYKKEILHAGREGWGIVGEAIEERNGRQKEGEEGVNGKIKLWNGSTIAHTPHTPNEPISQPTQPTATK